MKKCIQLEELKEIQFDKRNKDIGKLYSKKVILCI